jgi:hypothetical protein
MKATKTPAMIEILRSALFYSRLAALTISISTSPSLLRSLTLNGAPIPQS